MNENQINQFYNISIGSFSSIISKTITAPISRIQIIFQTQDANKRFIESGKQRYVGIIKTFSRVIKEEGWISLWRGYLPQFLSIIPSNILSLLLKDVYKFKLNTFNPETQKLNFFLANLASGGLAGGTSLIFIYPLTFARIRLAADIGRGPTERQFGGFIDCMKQIYQSDGIRGFYRGLSMSFAGIVLYRALYFGGYDTGKKLLLNNTNNFFLKFGFAQLVTFLSGALCYPVQIIQYRLIMQSGNKEPLYSGIIDCIQKTIKSEGLNGFYRGFSLQLITAIGGPLVLVFYDILTQK